MVVFAGAGVSIGPPSSYPGFDGLVGKIAEGTSFKMENNEPIDRFLGRMETGGLRVHEIAKDLLTDPNSRPNPLHETIVHLFGSPNKVRIVTTNFDAHFTTVVKDQLDDMVEIFKAPALPVGTQFSGLVYLHGSVDDSADRLVLTDSDFGRAYLTEGWARRFLQDLYGSFAVLFVGYSHDDVVMTYLTRGLPPNSVDLFSLAPEETVDHWNFLGIKPIPYRLRRAPYKHEMLKKSLSAWVDLSSMGILDHEQRIRSTVSAAPPLLGTEDDDYMQSVLQDEERVHFFARHARSIEWLLWAEDRHLLKGLFSSTTSEDKIFWTLANWFAEVFVLKHSEIALSVLVRQGQMMGRALWYSIAGNLHAAKELDEQGFSKWALLLAQNYDPRDVNNYLEYLLVKCGSTERWKTALALFDFLTRPRLLLEKGFAYEEGSHESGHTRSKVDIAGSHHWLNSAWKNIFKPNMFVFAVDLSRITSNNIQHAHDLAVCHHVADQGWDPLSFHRFAIEPHGQNRLNHDFDVVIDVARDSLEWLLWHNRKQARALVDQWIESSALILRRLAVHGMAVDRLKKADTKLKWAVEKGLIGASGTHHELFRLLRLSYPKANRSARQAILREVTRTTRKTIKANPDQDPMGYYHSLFEVYFWLDRSAGGKCSLVKGRLRRLRQKYPQFKTPKHPDFRHWSSGVRAGAESPVSADELLKKEPKTALPMLLGFKGKDFFLGPTREGLLHIVSQAVKSRPDWGLELAGLLRKKNKLAADLWPWLFMGWSDADLSEKQWNGVLSLLSQESQLLGFDREIAQLLERGIRKDEHGLPYSLLSKAERVAIKLWTAAASKYEPDEHDSKDWLHSAINHTGGYLAEFFLQVISLRRKNAEGKWRSIPKRLRDVLDKIVNGVSYLAEMGRVLLASRLHFLFNVDGGWTKKNLVPLLKWSENSRRAKQMWHGFLYWGKWSEESLSLLLPLYSQCFDRLDSELEDVAERFVEHIAGICMFSTRAQSRGSWLNRFLTTADVNNRKYFANAIGHILRDMDTKTATKAWKRWLKQYWANRLLGKPVPMTGSEFSEMVGWAPYLKGVFPEVVEKISESRDDLSVNNFIYDDLLNKGIADTYPEETVRLMLKLAEGSTEPIYHFGDMNDIIEKLIAVPATHPTLITLLDKMAAKGSTMASEFRKRIGT